MKSRITILEEQCRAFEGEMRDELWKLRHPPLFKHGDRASYNTHSERLMMKCDCLIILSEKMIISNQSDSYYSAPARIYYASIGEKTDIGKNIIEVDEFYLSPLPDTK